MRAISITRDAHGAAGLRRAASRSRDADAARRMLALALVLEGATRAEAARAAGMDRQTMRDWVHRYNAEGLVGLSDRPHPGGPARLLKAEQEAVVADWIRAGPNPAEHSVVRWRRVDLAAVIEQRFGVRLAERTVGTPPPADRCRPRAGHRARSPRQTPTSSGRGQGRARHRGLIGEQTRRAQQDLAQPRRHRLQLVRRHAYP
jgi:transposase